MDHNVIQSYLAMEGCDWIFNAPHSSHAGGVWEWMIGVTRLILDAKLAESGPKHVSREVLSMLMAEVAAIVNARPLVPVPTNPEASEILMPATLLTQKMQTLKPTPGNFSCTDLHSKQWQQVQHLANVFWRCCIKSSFLHSRQEESGNTGPRTLKRVIWFSSAAKTFQETAGPLAEIIKTFTSTDGKVRKVELLTSKEGTRKSYTRPVTEVILLRSEDDFKRMRTTAG